MHSLAIEDVIVEDPALPKNFTTPVVAYRVKRGTTSHRGRDAR
jgi:hypothetical protein